MIFIFFGGLPENKITAVFIALRALDSTLLDYHAMKLLCRCIIIPCILASLGFMASPATMPAQTTNDEQHPQVIDTPSRAEAASLQKKATQAQARIRANKNDRDQLMIAVKTNEVALAKQVLRRNGFSAEDLEDAKIILRTGGGKGGEDELEISATCCDPREITIRRSLEYFTK